jgi:hypothetical protein
MPHVQLPTLHKGQVEAFRIHQANRFLAVRCGRRWGKTEFGKCLASDRAVKRKRIGWFAPDYKISGPSYDEILDVLLPVKRKSSKTTGRIETITGGSVEIWTLENDRAGRSRHYDLVIIDEGAFTKDNMMDIWQQSILPTLLDTQGKAIVLSNTNGNDPANFFWRVCNQPEHNFVSYHAPSHSNPLIPFRLKGEAEADYALRRAAVFDKLKADNHPLVYQQEYLAEFVDWSGVAFFGLDKFLIDGLPVPAPSHCDGVLAIIDTAVKTGQEHDGTAVLYVAVIKRGPTTQTVLLDWDITQIEGSLLEAWLPNVYHRLQTFAADCGARFGSLGAFIEDKASGMILLQQARRRGWAATPIDSKLTSVGKDERAISVSGYVHQELVKVSEQAFNKTTNYKGTTRNHLMAQITGFRIGDKNASRQDDLLDCFTYACAITLGDGGGF